MHVRAAMKFLRIATVPVVSILIGVPTLSLAQSQTKAAAVPELPPVQLQPFTAQDRSVSAGVPAGWKVTSAVGGSVNLAGPNGEGINFGDVFVAHDGLFQLGQRGPSGVLMSMPATAKLSDKLVMFLQQQQSLSGTPVAQVKYIFAAPLQVPPALGQCGMFAVDFTGVPAPSKGMGIFCALAPDSARFFKVVLVMGTAPAAIAAKTVPTISAVYKSYKIAPGWLQKMLAPMTRAPVAMAGPGDGGAAATQMFMRSMANSQGAIDHGFRCADANILGDGSNWETPRECGGWAPNF